jgi:iron complex outermembrane receptor protein
MIKLKFSLCLTACLTILFSSHLQAQTDTIKEINLQEVVVKAFEQNRRLKDVPAAVNYVSTQTLNRFSSASIVSAVNSTPGIRMEERSPGSYRINIRGSSLRSPFGVRNVKIYYNDIPFTDPGGHSYLNNLGYYNFNSIEIVKGPGSSLYGAGTGGVMLIESLNENAVPGVLAEYTTGSYNLHNIYGALTTNNEKVTSRVGYQHQQNDGYRDQSGMRRDVLSWNGIFKLDEKRQIKTSFLYSDLFYETPGALTLAEYTANPKAARPGGGGFPGAVQARAAIYEKTFVAGASYIQPITTNIENKTTLYGMFTELRNPNVRAYDRSSEPHAGGRTVFTFKKAISQSLLTINAGAELQKGFTNVASHKSVNGIPDSLRTTDDIKNRQSFAFAQASIDVSDWTIIAGASWNQLKVRFQRYTPRASGEQIRKFDNEIAPRLSVLKKIKNITIYSSVAKGFSPPTTAELVPTGGAINLDLNAEDGVNYDLGFRGTFFNGLYVDVNAFMFSLRNTIVQRRDAGGGDFFDNAGKTKQHGIETYVSYPVFLHSSFVRRSVLWLSHTWHDFEYKDFKQVTNDFSGKKLPAEAPHTIATGFDFIMNNGLSALLTYYYSDKLPLNDANTAFAKQYNLIGLKLGYEKLLHEKFRFKFFTGVENLLDEKYSLGNDINGFGGRYYNAAPGRNYFAGIALSCEHKKS